jgi:hypothetical protein
MFEGFEEFEGFEVFKGSKVQLPAAFNKFNYLRHSIFYIQRFKSSIACGVQRFDCLRRSKVRGLKSLKSLKVQ